MTRWHSVTSGVVLRQLGDLGDHARRGPDPQHDAQLVAERARVDVGVVAADDAGLLEPPEPLADRRRGEPDARGPSAARLRRASSCSAAISWRFVASSC